MILYHQNIRVNTIRPYQYGQNICRWCKNHTKIRWYTNPFFYPSLTRCKINVLLFHREAEELEKQIEADTAVLERLQLEKRIKMNDMKEAEVKLEKEKKIKMNDMKEAEVKKEKKIQMNDKKEAEVKLEKEKKKSDAKKTLADPEIESSEDQSGSWTYSEVD